MTKQQRADTILHMLETLYPHTPIPLHHKDPYTLLIAVLLSAQCTDDRVNKITPALFALADNPLDMSKQPPQEIQHIIRPCGLAPRKSKAIHQLSHLLLQHHNGQVPNDMTALEALPGVGHKTASVVLAQAFGIPSVPVDTHIHRLAQRWKITNGKSVKQTEADIKALFPKKHWNKLHLQIIYYGRQHCQARACYGLTCPICTTLHPHRKTPIKTKKA